MKKVWIFIFVIALLCFGGCDDGREEQLQAEIDVLNAALADYAAYDELIGYVEAGDYAAAKALLDGYERRDYNESVSSGTVQQVDITPSNWGEYFEVRELTQWAVNDMGETTGFVTHVCLVLRDEYRNLVLRDDTHVDFQWQADCSVKNCTVDTVNRVVSIENVFGSNSTTFGPPETLKGTMSYDGDLLADPYLAGAYAVGKIGEIVVIGEYNFEGAKKPVCFDYENVTVTNAKGCLVLKGN